MIFVVIDVSNILVVISVILDMYACYEQTKKGKKKCWSLTFILFGGS